MTAATTPHTRHPRALPLADLADRRLDHGPAWLRGVRVAAVDRFHALGLPHHKLEEWRYTNPAPITTAAFALPDGESTVSAKDVERFAIPGLDAHRLVYVDGRFAPEHSDVGDLPKGVTLLPLSEAFDEHRKQLEPYLTAEGEASTAAFTRLNAALFEDGLLLVVERGVALDRPVHVLNIATETGEPLVTSPRNIIAVAENAQATVVEQYVSLTDGVYFTNAVTQIDAGQGANVHHYVIEQESPAAFQVSTLLTDQQRNSRVDSHTALFGGKLVRNNVNPRLNGEGCECLVNGLYLGNDQQHLDNHMRVEHNAAHGDSRQFYKGVLQGKAHAVFSGRIYVAKGAQKTDAKQTNANLLLSPTAQTTSKPQLEIYADDVKCTHGATIGQIDEEGVFYLMARGIDREAARALMIYAYAAESLERMTLTPVRDMLSQEIIKRLPQGDVISKTVHDMEV